MTKNLTRSGRAETGAASLVLRRGAVLVAGLGIVAAGLTVAGTARAAEDLTVTATANSLTASVEVSGCDATSSAAVYSVTDLTSAALVADAVPVPDWNHAAAFDFTWTGSAAGSYRIAVSCLGYNGSGTQTGSATVDLKASGLGPVVAAPEQWMAGAQVTLSTTGVNPGERVVFALAVANPDGAAPQTSSRPALDAFTWSATADSAGVATVTVTWPSGDPTGASAEGQWYLLTATSETQGTSELPIINLHDQWGSNVTGSSSTVAPEEDPGVAAQGQAPAGGTGSGVPGNGLPNTGD